MEVEQYLRDRINEIEAPELPPDNLESVLDQAIDPILCAMALQRFVKGMPPEAQNSFIRRGIHELGYMYAHSHLNRLTEVVIEKPYVIMGRNEAADLAPIMEHLQTGYSVRAGGRMGYFERHYYLNPTTGDSRPIVSLRLHSPAFQDPTSGEKVSLDNFITIPVTAFENYHIVDYDE